MFAGGMRSRKPGANKDSVRQAIVLASIRLHRHPRASNSHALGAPIFSDTACESAVYVSICGSCKRTARVGF